MPTSRRCTILGRQQLLMRVLLLCTFVSFITIKYYTIVIISSSWWAILALIGDYLKVPLNADYWRSLHTLQREWICVTGISAVVIAALWSGECWFHKASVAGSLSTVEEWIYTGGWWIVVTTLTFFIGLFVDMAVCLSTHEHRMTSGYSNVPRPSYRDLKLLFSVLTPNMVH